MTNSRHEIPTEYFCSESYLAYRRRAAGMVFFGLLIVLAIFLRKPDATAVPYDSVNWTFGIAVGCMIVLAAMNVVAPRLMTMNFGLRFEGEFIETSPGIGASTYIPLDRITAVELFRDRNGEAAFIELRAGKARSRLFGYERLEDLFEAIASRAPNVAGAHRAGKLRKQFLLPHQWWVVLLYGAAGGAYFVTLVRAEFHFLAEGVGYAFAMVIVYRRYRGEALSMSRAARKEYSQRRENAEAL